MSALTPDRLVLRRILAMRLWRPIVLMLLAMVLVGCVAHVSAVPVDSEVAPAIGYAPEGPYRLDTGDRLRVVVFGQEGLSNSYTIDAGGSITMPLIANVRARGLTTHELAQSIAGRLRQGYIREPHVAVEIEIHRPFFILGEVNHPGQYPYVAHMTIETAIAIAGGFTPRARTGYVEVTRPVDGLLTRGFAHVTTPVRPGDTIQVAERWF